MNSSALAATPGPAAIAGTLEPSFACAGEGAAAPAPHCSLRGEPAQVSHDSCATVAAAAACGACFSGDTAAISPALPAPSPADCASASSTPRSTASAATAAPALQSPALSAAASPEALDAETLHRVDAFVTMLLSAPLLASALTSLEAAGTHPLLDARGGAHAGGLRCTLASLLALHLRTGVATPSEDGALAALWTLESWWDAWRSPATVVLGDYVRHLAMYDAPRAVAMTADWRAAFVALRASVSGAQRALLSALRWRVRLDAVEDVAPCRAALFGPAAPWAARLEALCEGIERHGAAVRREAQAVDDSSSDEEDRQVPKSAEAEADGGVPAAKRRRWA